MKEAKIMTLKTGTNISKAKNDQMRLIILQALQTHGELTFTELNNIVGEQLQGNFDGSIGWYYTTARTIVHCPHPHTKLPTRVEKQFPDQCRRAAV